MVEKRKSRVLAITALGLVAGLAGGVLVAGVAVAGGADDAPPPGSGVFEKNQRGETFGTVADAKSPDEEPDLIKAEATNGKTGYVRKVELDGQLPKSPSEAVAYSQRQNESRTIAVFDSDGVTEIGKFTVGPGGGTQQQEMKK